MRFRVPDALPQRTPANPGIEEIGGFDQRRGGHAGGSASTRFSTWPSSPTSTTSALSGSSRTNSMCFSRELICGQDTAAAGSARTAASAPRPRLPRRLGATDGSELGLDRLPLGLGEIADLHQGIDEKAQASSVGSRPAEVCGA